MSGSHRRRRAGAAPDDTRTGLPNAAGSRPDPPAERRLLDACIGTALEWAPRRAAGRRAGRARPASGARTRSTRCASRPRADHVPTRREAHAGARTRCCEGAAAVVTAVVDRPTAALARSRMNGVQVGVQAAPMDLDAGAAAPFPPDPAICYAVVVVAAVQRPASAAAARLPTGIPRGYVAPPCSRCVLWCCAIGSR